MLFENNWLAQYPHPSQCIHDIIGDTDGCEVEDIGTHSIRKGVTTNAYRGMCSMLNLQHYLVDTTYSSLPAW